MLWHLDREWVEARMIEIRKAVVKIAMLLASAFGLGLRGEEVVNMDIAGFLTYYEAGRNHSKDKHVMIPLLGRFKGKTGERWYLLKMVWKTQSRIEAGTWATRLKDSLIERKQLLGLCSLPAVGNR
jgi:hypothetical protein